MTRERKAQDIYNAQRRAKRAVDKKAIMRGRYLRLLLNTFDLELRGFDPGVSAYRVGDTTYMSSYSFGQAEWAWLEPLLLELAAYRGSDIRLGGRNLC